MGYIDCKEVIEGGNVQRYFIPEQNWTKTEVKITNDDAHHMIRVMRFQLNDQIICNHPDGTAYLAVIERIDKQTVYARLVDKLDHDAELPVQVTILQGLPKGNKVEWIVQKGTELGASHFLFFDATRSISKWKENKIKQKIERYDKIVKEASEQCHRNVIPTVDYVGTLASFLENEQHRNALKLFAYEQLTTAVEKQTFYKQLQTVKHGDQIIICIGPEGGFSEGEVEMLLAHQFTPIRLGKRILRTETAPLYALASISYHFEEME